MTPIAAPARAVTLAVVLLLAPATPSRAAATPSPADRVLAQAPTAAWIAEGQGRRVVYVLFDPNCPSCALLHRNLQTLIAAENLQVRWLPVAVVSPTSLGKAAAMLQARDPRAALRQNEARYQEGRDGGGIDEDIPTAATERKLRANKRLLKTLDIPVVPSMLFAGADGRAVLIQGALSPFALRKVFARLPR